MPKRRTMSAAGRRRIVAAQKAEVGKGQSSEGRLERRPFPLLARKTSSDSRRQVLSKKQFI
jgi:hypothetical protein